MAWRDPPREAAHGEVKATPKEMNWACLAQEAGSKELKDTIYLHERAPEAMGGLGIIGSVGAIL
jgi:hypothetical protein